MEDILLKTLDEAVGSQLHKSVYELEEDTNFFDVGLDSIGFINIIISLENAYDIFIDQDDLTLEQFSTIRNIRKYVKNKTGK